LKGETVKARFLAIAVVLICAFVLPPSIRIAAADEWYQGQPGSWHRSGSTWMWRGSQGDQWYQGQRGHWYAEPGNKWYWLSDSGATYREGPKGWYWTGQRHKHHHHHG
jgi:hypothetical protein